VTRGLKFQIAALELEELVKVEEVHLEGEVVD
jgi:hypothetical protein